MLAKYLTKLERHGALPVEERNAFLALPFIEQSHPANVTISEMGNPVTHCIIMGTGLTSRVKILQNRERQIVAFNIPGDAPDLQGLLLDVADHSIHTHALTHIVSVAHTDIRAITRCYPILAEALWLDTLIEASISREWTVNVGQRLATARIAHLFLEMEARFAAIGQCTGSYVLGLNQTELSQALALSLVHLNKSLQKLRHGGLVEMRSGRVTILDREGMQKLAGFDAGYLHLGSAREQDKSGRSSQHEQKS